VDCDDWDGGIGASSVASTFVGSSMLLILRLTTLDVATWTWNDLLDWGAGREVASGRPWRGGGVLTGSKSAGAGSRAPTLSSERACSHRETEVFRGRSAAV